MPFGKDVVVMVIAVVLAEAMLSSTASDFTPVAVFINWTWATPGTARLALSTGLATVLLSSIVVARGLPFQRTTVELLIRDPTISTVVLPEPAVTACGMIWLIAGTPAFAIPTPPQPTTKKQTAINKVLVPILVNVFKIAPLAR